MKTHLIYILSYLKRAAYCFFIIAIILLSLNNFIYSQSRGGQGGLRSIRTFSDGRSIEKSVAVESFNYTVELFPGDSYIGAWFYWSLGGHLTAHLGLTTPDSSWLEVTPLTFSSDSCSDIASVQFYFKAPSYVGEYIDTLVDSSGNWDNTVVTLRVTNSPWAYGPYYADELVAEANSDTITRTYNNIATPLGCVDHYAPVSASLFQFYFNPYVSWMKVEGTYQYSTIIYIDDSASVRYTFSNDTTGGSYTYLIESRGQGEHSYPNYYLFFRTSPVNDVQDSLGNGIPAEFKILQNYPNPFNPATNIVFQIPVRGLVSLKVYDILGRDVATLVNEVKPAGSYRIKFDGSKLASGIYFCRMQSGSFVQTKKMLLLK